MEQLKKNAYVVLNPDDILTLKEFKHNELVEKIGEKGNNIDNYISLYDLENIDSSIHLPKEINEGDVLVCTAEKNYEVIHSKADFENVLKSRVPVIQEIARLLGCTFFKGSNEIICKKKAAGKYNINSKTDVNIPAEETTIPLGDDLSISITNNLNENQQGRVEVSSEFVPFLVTKANFDKAKELAKQYNLDKDQWIHFLIEQRNPDGALGVITNTNYTISLAHDLEEGLDSACNLGFSLGNIIDSKLNISEEIQIALNYSYEFNCEIKFPSKEGPEYNAHEHVNFDVLSNITADKVENWDNAELNAKAYADNLNSATIVRVEGLKSQASHKHENQLVLSGITADKVENWDNAELNAKTYADDLNSTTIVRVEGLEAQAHEHPNEDALSEISIGSIALWNTSPKIIAECDARLNGEKLRINNLEKKSHEHKNNEILEHINEDNIKSWNAAESNAKQYTESVSSRAEQSAKDHANQLNNQTTQSINSLKEQLQQQKHSNREVLDGISTERVKKWDNSEQNAINHSDDIKLKLTKRIDDLNWILTEKMNAQESLLQQTIERHIAYETKLKKILIALGCVAIVGFLLSVLLIFDV